MYNVYVGLFVVGALWEEWLESAATPQLEGGGWTDADLFAQCCQEMVTLSDGEWPLQHLQGGWTAGAATVVLGENTEGVCWAEERVQQCSPCRVLRVQCRREIAVDWYRHFCMIREPSTEMLDAIVAGAEVP